MTNLVLVPATRDDALAAIRLYFENRNWHPRDDIDEAALELMRRALENDRRRVAEREDRCR